MMKINLIYSESMDGIIGVNNDLYCKLSSDLKMFQQITSLKFNIKPSAIIMGYNTWGSIGKPLEGRTNIVISQNHIDEFIDKPVLCYQSLDECFRNIESSLDIGKIFIIGGQKLFEEVVLNHKEKIDIIYHTQIIDNIESHYHPNIIRSHIPLINYMMEGFIKGIDSKQKEEEGKIYDFKKEMYVTKMISYHENIYQNKINVNEEELQYLDLLKKILKDGSRKESRNSVVYSLFGNQMRFDLRKGFPMLTTKKMPWKTILRELIWFINGSTDNKLLQEKNVHIWDGNSTKEFLATRGLDHYEEGDLGPIYGFQWRHFGAEYENHKTDYTDKGIDQLKNIIDEIKKNPGSRRLIMSAWNPNDLEKMALPPCHVMVQFNIDGEYIDAQLYQRSGDMFLGVPFNITSYSFLLSIIGTITGYIPRYFVHTLGDCHIYENHIEAVTKQLKRVPTFFPTVTINKDIDIEELKETDFTINDYEYYPTIKAEMIA